MVKAAKAHSSEGNDALLDEATARRPAVKAEKGHSSEGNDALLDEATARQANTRSERNDAGRKAEGGSRMQQR